MRRAIAPAVLLSCAAFAFSQAPGFPDLNVRQSAARAAVERAVRALEAGDAEGAREASDEARYLDPGNSDARYLLAAADLRGGRPTPEAEGELRTALAGGTFLRYTADDAARLLAHILVRTKRYSEALALASRPGLAGDSDALYLRVRALRFLGDPDAFLRAVDAGLDRFPSDARIPRELLAFTARTPRTEPTAARVGRVEARLGYYRFLDPEILSLLAPFRPDPEARRDLILEYRATGRRNPAATVRALDLGILDDAQAVTEFFGFPSLSWEDLRDLRGFLRGPEGRAAFASAFSGYSGVLGSDPDGDGYFETRSTVRDGAVESWLLDFDQDGLPELSLRFLDDLPGSGRMTLTGAETVFEYGEYPYLNRVLYRTSSGVREYLFSPDALAFPAVELFAGPGRGSGEGFAPRRTDAAFPTEAACAAAAFRVTARPEDRGSPVSVTDLDRGVPVRGRIRTPDGRDGILVYRNGMPQYELADMDGDGLYESRFLYPRDPKRAASGTVSSPYRFEADFNLDGVFEYAENLTFPFERTWDYDGDGRTDARATALGDGGELREFSRRFDGRLDTAVLVRGGRVQRVLRAGVELPLVPDAGGAVLWVGRKPFDFGTVLPEPGFGRRGAERYRIVRFGDQILAESAE
ncbi:MAG TPA: hypothetical protein PLB56_05060 [Spirochaetales bacterium]|nr:hypothetical protein [Spirochaetales bacterium]